MREIEFRAWDGKKFLTPILCDGEVFKSGRDFEDYVPCNLNAEQYTGLRDINGVKIFEGDIVESSLFVCHLSVYYNDELAMFRLSAGADSDDGDFIQYGPENFKVIGNIHQNPELLSCK